MQIKQNQPNSVSRSDFIAFMEGSTRAVQAHQALIDALNVFPVPDGDTGTNMALTLDYIREQIDKSATSDASDTLRLMARAALLGARGNSGLILSQFFRGVSESMGGSSVCTLEIFAQGMAKGAELAEKAIGNPREGTMLTVMRETGKRALEFAALNDDFPEMLKQCSDEALEAVKRTPEQLDVLKKAGVVDAGGLGFATALKGAYATLIGEPPEEVELPADLSSSTLVSKGTLVQRGFVDETGHEEWGYCVVFAITGEGLALEKIQTTVSELGRSVVVAGDSSLVKVHIHSEDPGKPLSIGHSFGQLENIQIANMDRQTEEWAKGRQIEVRVEAENVKTAVVAVVTGEGMMKAFENSGLGAIEIIDGGNTMNPNASQIAQGIDKASCDSVLVLPNNSNVLGTAKLATELSTKKVAVLETTSMQAGLSMLLSFTPDEDFDTNKASMESALKNVQNGSVFRSVRNTEVGGVTVKEGDYIGIVENKVEVASSPRGALFAALESSTKDGDIVSIYYGKEVEEKPEDLVRDIEKRLQGVEAEVMCGGQPHYIYLISIE